MLGNQCNNIAISRQFWASDKSSPLGWCSMHQNS